MFTGIVETTGHVASLQSDGGEVRLRITVRFAGDLRHGDSVSVDGVCLTVAAQGPDWFEATASPETVSRTTLGLRRAGHLVNLERALRVGDRLGGHLVQGHVDGVGMVEAVSAEGSGTRVRIGIPEPLSSLIVLKGSVAVDGVSLTVALRAGSFFEVALIPETLGRTRLKEYAPGTPVNLEVDLIGRYVVEYLRAPGGLPPEPAVTREHLLRHGFQKSEEMP